MGITQSTLCGWTPVCDDCGVHLCWDISPQEYKEAKGFWDNWKCKDCNPDYKGSLQRFLMEKHHENN